jgi:hypothetical protein
MCEEGSILTLLVPGYDEELEGLIPTILPPEELVNGTQIKY